MEALNEASKHRLAVEMVTGGDPSATCEALGDFVQCMSTESVPSDMRKFNAEFDKYGSDYRLISILFSRVGFSDLVIADATRELARRYLDSDGTKAIIQRLCKEMGK
jgi:hypothetical protein